MRPRLRPSSCAAASRRPAPTAWTRWERPQQVMSAPCALQRSGWRPWSASRRGRCAGTTRGRSHPARSWRWTRASSSPWCSRPPGARRSRRRRGGAGSHRPPLDTPGTRITVTDASGDDGVGGIAYDVDRPNEVVLVSEAWPDFARAALARAAAARVDFDVVRDAVRRRDAACRDGLSVPAAEAFGIHLVSAIAAEAFVLAAPTTAGYLSGAACRDSEVAAAVGPIVSARIGYSATSGYFPFRRVAQLASATENGRWRSDHRRPRRGRRPRAEHPPALRSLGGATTRPALFSDAQPHLHLSPHPHLFLRTYPFSSSFGHSHSQFPLTRTHDILTPSTTGGSTRATATQPISTPGSRTPDLPDRHRTPLRGSDSDELLAAPTTAGYLILPENRFGPQQSPSARGAPYRGG